MKEEKVRIKVRLTEEEKEKLERQQRPVRSVPKRICPPALPGYSPEAKTTGCVLAADGASYIKAHSDLKECAKYEPSALELCTEIEQLVLDLQEVI